MNTALLVALVVLLVACSAFFSSSEIAFAQANKPRLRLQAEQGDRRAVRALKISEDYLRAIATILVGNDMVNIASTSVITLLCTEMLFPGNLHADLYAELCATLVLLVFGEIFPKLLAAEKPNRLVLRYSGPLSLAMRLFRPVVWAVSALVHFLEPLWIPKEQEPRITDEELAMVVDSIQEEGVISEAESELIKSAIEFRDVKAHEILVPRVDMRVYDIDAPLSDILSDPVALNLSRLPVYREDIDHIIGILPTKQLVKAVLSAGEGEPVNVESMLLPPTFVHMTKSVGDILREMRQTQTHMVFVLDEYGGVMGLLTLEDILEEIVGDIYDETDEEEPEEVVQLRQDTFQLDGSMNIWDALAEMEVMPHDFETPYTTLSGWITGMLDRFPQPGDSFCFDRLTVTVLSVEGVLVEQARIVVGEEA